MSISRRGFIGTAIGLAVATQLPWIAEAADWKEKVITKADLDEYIARRFAGFRLALIGNERRKLTLMGQGDKWWAPPLQIKSLKRGEAEFETAEVVASKQFYIDTAVFVDHRGYKFGERQMVLYTRPKDIVRVSYKITWNHDALARTRDDYPLRAEYRA